MRKAWTVILVVLALGLLRDLPVPAWHPVTHWPFVALHAQGSRYSGCVPKNAQGAVATQVTLTLNGVVGQYIYLCSWDISVSTNGTGTAQNNVSWTSTNLGASGSTWAWQYSAPATAQQNIIGSFGYSSNDQPVRSQTTGTNVTFVSPAAAANNAYSINAYFFVDY